VLAGERVCRVAGCEKPARNHHGLRPLHFHVPVASSLLFRDRGAVIRSTDVFAVGIHLDDRTEICGQDSRRRSIFVNLQNNWGILGWRDGDAEERL